MLGQPLFYSPALAGALSCATGFAPSSPLVVAAGPAQSCMSPGFAVLPTAAAAQQLQYSAYLSALMLAGDCSGTAGSGGLVYQPIRVNWATSPASQPKLEAINKYSQEDLRHHYHIFVGDLSPDIETHQLREAFSAFGDVSDAKIIKDTVTQKSKGYGFISFAKKEEAQKAITEMNGAWLGSRAIRTNWATRKPAGMSSGDRQQQQQLGPGCNPGGGSLSGKLGYEDVYAQSSVTNCTVYVGGLNKNLSEEVLQLTFSQFGVIKEVRVFKDKGYAFVRFASKDSATKAICEVHGTDVAGNLVKCSWGKESNDQVSNFSVQHTQQQQQPSQQQQQQYGFSGQYFGAAAAAYSPSSFYSSPTTNVGAFGGAAAPAPASTGSATFSPYSSYAAPGYTDYASYSNYGQFGAYGQ